MAGLLVSRGGGNVPLYSHAGPRPGIFSFKLRILFLDLEIVKLGENGIDIYVGFRLRFFGACHAKNTGFGRGFFMRVARRHFAGHKGLTAVFLDRLTILGGAVDFQIEIHLGTKPERDRIYRRQRR
jgi:hypothetical protein